MKTGQTHVQRYADELLPKILDGVIDPSFIITHQLHLVDAAEGYDMFERKDDCVKVVRKP